ncbi:hypothetical protein HRG_005756 [Hirsutella rhossiliensis]|uniref:Nucleoside phosphorylase domain-containing protein n=1 Tax=Hirsutella rhossiliensis TaxID=111463 RepID=A0A9P8SJP3_9HYPO|nr:uncharacterized protein HRG_05756 [Hirsutella rhossiliensis]KAH0963246.1 hypothetical protein HRG_05756 [Hirsutella rhossiliensis]
MDNPRSTPYDRVDADGPRKRPWCSTALAAQPSHRGDFDVAIICALPLEYDAACLLFDEFYDEDGDLYGRATGDLNTYTTGRIGNHSVVVALLNRMGKASAAGNEILLGDVVIGKTIVQYDFGRQYPDKYMRKDAAGDNLGIPSKEVRNMLVRFETERGRKRLQQSTAAFLKQLQANAARDKLGNKYQYPGTAEDKLFRSNYRHKHRTSPVCSCKQRLREKQAMEQEVTDGAQDPDIFVGSIASGDTVMKSGDDRDEIAARERVIGFEMEAAGVWEELPSIVVKGVCDYADSHKHKRWQNFAAATAASAMKALLEAWVHPDGLSRPAISPEVNVQVSVNNHHVLRTLLPAMLPNCDGH